MFIYFAEQYTAMPRTPKNPDKALQNGPLEKLFNGTISARILDFLSTFKEYDYSKQDIAKNSGVSMRHALQEITKLEQLGLIIKTRNVGHSHMYKYNTQNKAAALLSDFNLELAYQACQKIIEREALEEATEAEAKDPAQQQPEIQPETEPQELLTAPA